MAFDECIENPAPYEYVKNSVARTARWLCRCRAEMDRLNSLPETINRHQMLFGINQGGTYEDLRIAHMQEIAEIPCEGYAIGGLAVGEETEEMYRIIDAVEPYMPADKPRYLMGVGISLQHSGGGASRCGFLRLRHAFPQRAPRKSLYVGRKNQYHERKIYARPAPHQPNL